MFFIDYKFKDLECWEMKGLTAPFSQWAIPISLVLHLFENVVEIKEVKLVGLFQK